MEGGRRHGTLTGEVGNTNQQGHQAGGGEKKMGEGFVFFPHHIPHGQLNIGGLGFQGLFRGGIGVGEIGHGRSR